MNTPITLKSISASVSQRTTDRVEPGWISQIAPEFIEISDVHRLFGLRRTYTFQLIREGKIKSVLLRRTGNRSGKRLLFAASIRAFLMSHMEGSK